MGDSGIIFNFERIQCTYMNHMYVSYVTVEWSGCLCSRYRNNCEYLQSDTLRTAVSVI